MMLRRESPTPVRAGTGAWSALRRTLGSRTLVIADSNIDIAGAAVRLDPRESDLSAVCRLAEQLTEHQPDTVVGVGGGSVLDLVKLACLVHADPRMAEVLAIWGQRAGVIALPHGDYSLPQRVFVPTTVGTGVEVSAVACVRIGEHKRIVISTALRPDLAVLDPDLTASLRVPLLREGVLEALLRILGPVAGSPPAGGLPDAEAAMLARQLVLTGDRIAAGDTGADVRLMAAMLSAATHTGWTLAGREVFAAKHWYLANELSTTLGLRKMVATACLLPAVWTRIEQGDTRFGDATALATAWRWVDDSAPVPGLRALLRRWHIEPEVRAPQPVLTEAARRAIASWGGRLPMLADLSVPEVERLYAEVVSCST